MQNVDIVHFCVHALLLRVCDKLLERDQVLRVRLTVVEHDKDRRVGNTVHHRVVQNVGLPGLIWRNSETSLTLREDASQHTRQVHAFDTVTIWLRVGVTGRVA